MEGLHAGASLDLDIDTSPDLDADTSLNHGADTSLDLGADASPDHVADASLDHVADASPDHGADAVPGHGADAAPGRGVGESLDALLARVLVERDPESAFGWHDGRIEVMCREDKDASVRWALSRLDDPDPDVRWFTAVVVDEFSTAGMPCPDEARAVLAARLPVETNSDVLICLISAFAGYHDAGHLPEIQAHAGHPDPRVREWVAGVICWSMPEKIDLLTDFAQDPDPRVRATVLGVCRYAFDHPVTARFSAALRDDPDPEVRALALEVLARDGDAAAYQELRRLGDEAGEESQATKMADAVQIRLRD
ncbi:hypothetical protein GCM10009828_081370 [Actinoplanes couchii]|uniref:PBS lyase HEAT domain protein repeat-containing protein n=1 Tax=Actinoplanes couchii TaxID=403638 RepID=A0ABQ3XKF5_9ACTN|nr:hypothetical protein Aco03nite_073860 [Actinoplanes couchii]